jgi:hypothetical protein
LDFFKRQLSVDIRDFGPFRPSFIALIVYVFNVIPQRGLERRLGLNACANDRGNDRIDGPPSVWIVPDQPPSLCPESVGAKWPH